MNKALHGIMGIALVGILIVLVYLAFADRDITLETNNAPQDNTISVSGEAETFVKPDTARIALSVTKKAPNTEEAMDSVNARMDTLVKALKKIGIDDGKDIKTVKYDVSPEYRYDDGKRVFTGYRVSQRITVIIRDLEDVSAVLSTVNTAGVDDVSQLSFYVDENEEIMADLRKEAIDDAKDKAKILADNLGVKLTEIVGFSEGGSVQPQPFYRNAEYTLGAMDDVSEAVVPTGENQFSAQVSITYKIQ